MGKFTRGNKVRVDEKCLQEYMESSDMAIIEGTQSELFPTTKYSDADSVYRILILNKINQAFARYQWIEEVHLTSIATTTVPGLAIIEEYEAALLKQS